MSVFSPEVIITNTPLPVDGSGVVQPVSGPLTDTQLRATSVPVSGPLTDAQLRATAVPVTSSPVVSSSSTVTQLTSTGANQTLLAANASRKKALLFFSSGIWNVKFGTGASATSRTLQVTSGSSLVEVTTWVGQIDALCTTSGKLVDVTELV